MREIKFRGKRADNRNWVYGLVYKVHLCNGSYILNIQSESYIVGETTLLFAIDPATVGQYTGLKDKNGKEIYEGDILSCGDGNVPTLITWHDESHAYYAYNLKRKEHHRLDKFFLRYIGEVIGNIHDNPELPEVSE